MMWAKYHELKPGDLERLVQLVNVTARGSFYVGEFAFSDDGIFLPGEIGHPELCATLRI
jgi:hypothetical protein